MKPVRQHPFWGSLSPFGGLTGAGLLIMATGRLSWALTTAGCVLWVYTLSVLASAFLCSDICKRFFPLGGRPYIFICISSFFGSLYLLLFWLLCPFAALEVFLPLSLAPLYCAGSGILARVVPVSAEEKPGGTSSAVIGEAVSAAAAEAAVLAGLLIVVSVMREPLCFCSLSLPGTYRGMVTLFSFNGKAFFPVRIMASSAGALLLLGYISGLYQYFRSKYAPSEGEL